MPGTIFREGFVTVQDDPRFDDDAEHIVDVTMRCQSLGKNFMTKIPVIVSGVEAIEELVARNVPICATEIFAVSQAVHICEVYRRAAAKSGNHPPFYVTHITGIFDQYMAETVKAERIAIAPDILAQAGCIIARKEYRLMKERGYEGTLLGGGARGTQHFTEFVGGDLHITINWSTAEELVAASLHDEVGWIRLGARAIGGVRSVAPAEEETMERLLALKEHL